MSMDRCLTDLVAKKEITPERAAAMRDIYDDLVAHYGQSMAPAAAEGLATRQAMKAIDSDFLNRKRQKLLQYKAQREIYRASREVYDGGQKDGPINGKALLSHLVQDEKARGIQNVEYRWKNIKQQAFGRMNKLLERFRANMAGQVRNRSDLDDMVRELGGEATGNLNAREFADAWRDVAEWLRLRFNAAGGRIAKLEGWALPHRWDGQRVGAVDADQWVAEMVPRLDRDQMLDRVTGEPLSDAKLEAVLRDVYETIASDGWNTRNPGGVGVGSMANRNAEHRVLHFKSADDWLAMNERFGAGSPYEAMLSHVETMSRDIAAMEILGPNPAATVRWMQDLATGEAATKGTMKDRARASVASFEIGKVWNEVTGANNRAVRRGLALAGSTLRNWQTGAKLGSASLTAVSDHGTAMVTRAYNGIPVTQEMGRYLKQLNPARAEDRAFARRHGIISDEMLGRMAGAGRMHIEDSLGGRLSGGQGALLDRLEQANEFSRRLADGVLRASGLNAHTIAMREWTAMEFWAAAADFAPRGWDAIDGRWRGFLERYGVDEGQWDALRATELTDHKGGSFLTPDKIGDQALQNRFVEAILTETDFAVPAAGLYTRAIVNVAPPGTWIGEIMRVGFQFKSFPIAVMASHGMRMMSQASLGKKATYAAAFLGATGLMGMMALQLAELAKGRDPVSLLDPDNWWKAMLKGGGLGIYGDLINSTQNQFGQSMGDMAAGPVWSLGDNLSLAGRAGWESAAAAIDADDPERAEKAAKLRGRATRQLLMREVPGSSLWYTRMAYERLLVDTVAGWAGEPPDAYDRMERYAAEQGTGYYARPGAGSAGLRMPDFTNLLATEADSEAFAQ